MVSGSLCLLLIFRLMDYVRIREEGMCVIRMFLIGFLLLVLRLLLLFLHLTGRSPLPRRHSRLLSFYVHPLQAPFVHLHPLLLLLLLLLLLPQCAQPPRTYPPAQGTPSDSAASPSLSQLPSHTLHLHRSSVNRQYLMGLCKMSGSVS